MLEGVLLLSASIMLVVAITALLKLRHNNHSSSNRLREERDFRTGAHPGELLRQDPLQSESQTRRREAVKLRLVSNQNL